MLGTVLQHPNTVDILIGRARFGAAGLTLFERILSILLRAGFSPEAAFDAYQSLYLFTLGFSAVSGRNPEFREGQRPGRAVHALAARGSIPVDHDGGAGDWPPPPRSSGDRTRRRDRGHRGVPPALHHPLTAGSLRI